VEGHFSGKLSQPPSMLGKFQDLMPSDPA